MRPRAKTLIPILFLLWSPSAPADEFADAIARSKDMNLTNVNATREGVPFYAEKTLDPVWDDGGRIVKIDDLSLIDQNGRERNATLFDGKTTFVAFFFASCSGFCPTLLRNLQEVEAKIAAKPGIDQFVAITVDPDHDRPKELKAYAKKMRLSGAWTLLTGSEERIFALARETFAAEAFRRPKSKGQIAHSEHFYVLDGKRRLLGVLKGTRRDVGEKALELVTALRR